MSLDNELHYLVDLGDEESEVDGPPLSEDEAKAMTEQYMHRIHAAWDSPRQLGEEFYGDA